jgi:hypothetical protein
MELKNEGYCMKKILIVGFMLMMFAGVVNASSTNGDYKGNPIVKVFNNGVEVVADDAPAMIYSDRTMVPIYILKKMGIIVEWNAENYSVSMNINFTPNKVADPTPAPAPAYSFNDAVIELGFTNANNMTVAAKELALDLVNVRKTKKQSDYSVYDALSDLGFLSGQGIITLDAKRLAVQAIANR